MRATTGLSSRGTSTATAATATATATTGVEDVVGADFGVGTGTGAVLNGIG